MMTPALFNKVLGPIWRGLSHCPCTDRSKRLLQPEPPTYSHRRTVSVLFDYCFGDGRSQGHSFWSRPFCSLSRSAGTSEANSDLFAGETNRSPAVSRAARKRHHQVRQQHVSGVTILLLVISANLGSFTKVFSRKPPQKLSENLVR